MFLKNKNKNRFLLLFFLFIFSACKSADKEAIFNLENFTESPLDYFLNYATYFNKPYIHSDNHNLIARKYETFYSNVLKIIEHNKENKNLYKLGITQFTDSSLNELKDKYLDMNMSTRLGLKFLSPGHVDISTHEYTPIDWRSEEIFLPARNQGDCGGCWAFATAGTIEAMRAIKFGEKKYLSPQQMIDCDSKEKGCKGGWPSIAYNYVIKNGLVSEDDYPYKGENDQCSNDIVHSSTLAKIKSPIYSCEEEECMKNDYQYKLLKNGPVTIVIDAYNSNFFNYKRGIYDEQCGEPNHAIVLVGYGVDGETGTKYWIIRNSWGSDWGMKGYGYVKFDLDNYLSCNINRYGFQPIVLN